METSNASPGGPAKPCFCPYCDHEAEPMFPFCGACGKPLSYCPKCACPLPAGAQACPSCGEPVPERDAKEG